MKLSFMFHNHKQRKEEIKKEIKAGEYTIWSFLFPKFSRAFFIRLIILIVVSWLFFYYICIPAFVSGASMMPTYPERGFTFCWAPAYWFSEPERGDVVVLRYAGRKNLLLKRLIAFEGETVEFRDGVCYVDGIPLDEPYVEYDSHWNIPPRLVGKGKIFVVGDNRSMEAEAHIAGEIDKKRIMGKPLW